MSNQASDREKRRAAALRQNLKRRKTAARSAARAATSVPVPPAPETLDDRPNTAKKPL